MAVKDIKDEKSLEAWLKGRPVEDARVIAARAALRTAFSLQSGHGWKAGVPWEARVPGVVLSTFRGYAVSWTSAAFPSGANALRSAAHAVTKLFDAAMEADTTLLGFRGLYAAARAAHVSAPANAATPWLTPPDASNAFFEATKAAAAADTSVSNAMIDFGDTHVMWDNIRADVERLERGSTPSAVTALSLWPDGAPIWATTKWEELRTALLLRPAEHWSVWIDWYEARLRGASGNEEEEIARVLEVTEEEWKAGPAVANKKIKDIVARFRNAPKASATIRSSAAATTTPIIASNAATKGPAFISHASQADGARASALTRDLEAAGIPCWIAPRDIPSGADWNGAIVSAIDSCEAMILLVSDAALKSPFVKAEVQHAFERGKRVFPVRLADSIEAGQIDLRLKIVQHIDGRGETHTIVASILKSLS